ncbi:MAG: hypothetical protein GXP10_01220 [Gammaproteobacteria bacterium]|nr:hypothetical protein [Gammaproteobacteria bacterium]
MTSLTLSTVHLNHDEKRLLDILREHPGQGKAIRLIDLYEQWAAVSVPRNHDGSPAVNVPTVTRAMRYIIGDLIEIYAIPIMSSTAHGYWILANEWELTQARKELMKRGIFSLQKAARLGEISLIEQAEQMVLDLKSNGGESALINKKTRRRIRIKPTPGETMLSAEARLAAVSDHLTAMSKDPEKYDVQLRALQERFGAVLMPKSMAKQIKQATEKMLADVARLSELVGA